jgi:hypothetical protein
MSPAKPPLPRPRSFLFQPATGNHTSILMSESMVGLAVADTRQNGGSDLYKALMSRPENGAGGPTNVPASTSRASVIVVAATASLASRSQADAPVSCATAAELVRAAAQTRATSATRRCTGR